MRYVLVEVTSTVDFIGELHAVASTIFYNSLKYHTNTSTHTVRCVCSRSRTYISQLCGYLYTTGYFKRRVMLKQQFTIEKGYYVNHSTKKYCSTPYLLSRKVLRLPKFFEPYLVEQNRMANAQLLWYGSKHLGQNFFFN